MTNRLNQPIEYGLKKVNLPLIIVDINGHNACFLIDTGATLNLIDKRVYEHFKELLKKVGNISQIGIDGILNEAERVEISFKFENYPFTSLFTIFDTSKAFDRVEKESGIQIHGVLGNEFLLEHKWIIDYEKLSVFSK